MRFIPLFSTLALTAALAAQAPAPQPAEPPGTELLLRYRTFDPLRGEPAIPPLLLASATNRLFIVQFKNPITQRFRDGLQRAGAAIHTYLPARSYLVRIDPRRIEAVRALDYVRWVGAYHPAYRLEPRIIGDLLSGADLGARRYNLVLVDQHRDARALESAVENAGGKTVLRAGGGILMEAMLTPGQLLQVANADSLLWIDRWSAPEEDIDNARIQGGADYVESVAGIDGKGMRGHVCEGVYATHPEFAARPPYRTTPLWIGRSTPQGHGNATAGEIYAMGKLAGYKGLVPFSQMSYTNYFYVINQSTRYPLTRDLVDAKKQYKAMAETASWGYSRTTQYTSRSAEMDTIIFDHDIFTTQSQSNAGATSNPRMSRPQAWAKNIVGVGGFRHYNNSNPADDCWCRTGSTGPAADGRIGPMLAGYYDSIKTTGYSSRSYTTGFGGTSGATPMVNGFGQITIQLFTEGLFGYPKATWQTRFAFKPHFTTTKALMVATAHQLSFAKAARVQQGYGFPNVKDMYDLRDNMLVLDELDVLRQGQHRTYLVWVKPGMSEFRAVMHHADPAASPSASITRINSLNMKVTVPGGATYWGVNGLKSGPYSTPGGSADDRETLEAVFLNRPASGLYSVDVHAAAVRTDTHKETAAVDADFALVVRGIGGGRDKTGAKLDLISGGPGDLRVSLTNLPAGWTIGYTMFSLDTGRHVALGNVLGVEADGLSEASLAQVPSLGNVFAFTRNASRVYPNAQYGFPAWVATVLRGRTIDAVAFVADAAGRLVAASNVDRVTVR